MDFVNVSEMLSIHILHAQVLAVGHPLASGSPGMIVPVSEQRLCSQSTGHGSPFVPTVLATQ